MPRGIVLRIKCIINFSLDFYRQPHREALHHRPACTWAINRRTNKRVQFLKRRHHQSFLVPWSIRVKRARHVRTMCTTRYDASATCPLTVPGDRSDHQLSHRVRSLHRRYCRRAERPRVLSPMHWYGISIHIQRMKQILTSVSVYFQSPEDSDLSADISRLHLNRKVSRDESDESEASSICSERSFDSFRRNEVSSTVDDSPPLFLNEFRFSCGFAVWIVEWFPE